jgi:trehalose 6-phosphate phosphatase
MMSPVPCLRRHLSPGEDGLQVPSLKADHALFLDIDGTLIDVAPSPEEVSVPRELPDLLHDLQTALGGALALVTGRQVSAADRLMAPQNFIVSGVHGTQLRGAPAAEALGLAPRVPDELVRVVRGVAGGSDAIFVEHKRSGLAVHFRKAPAAGVVLNVELTRLLERWPQYELRGGRMVLEIVPRGYSKATAISALMQNAPFRGRVPVAIGDDHGDDPALVLARKMGGLGLTVGGEHFDVARSDFANATAVRAWLRELLAILNADPKVAHAPMSWAGELG